MSNNNAARLRGANAIEARIRSERVKGGAYSCFARLRAENIAACAAHIAAIYACREPDADELMRGVQRYETRYPQAAHTIEQISASIRSARHIEQQKVPVKDINKQVLKRLTALELLDLANTGSLPDRFVVLAPEDA